MRLLLALDIHRDDAERLVDRASDWAGRTGATLDLTWVDRFGTWTPTGPFVDRTLRERLLAEVARGREADRRHLDALRARIPEACRGEARATTGDPVLAIPTLAEGYALLMLGPGERVGDQVGIGSIEAQLIRRAPGPVLVLGRGSG